MGTPSLAQAPSRLFFLPAQRLFPPELGSERVRFVEQGGGLALFAGESFSPIRYQAELGALLPATPGTAEGEPNRRETHWRRLEGRRFMVLASPSPCLGGT
jgi:hypothetical protein